MDNKLHDVDDAIWTDKEIYNTDDNDGTNIQDQISSITNAVLDVRGGGKRGNCIIQHNYCSCFATAATIKYTSTVSLSTFVAWGVKRKIIKIGSNLSYQLG